MIMKPRAYLKLSIKYSLLSEVPSDDAKEIIEIKTRNSLDWDLLEIGPG